MPAEFLAQFPPGRRHVILARIDMAAARRIPAAGKGVLRQTALLEKEVAVGVVNEHVDRAMQQLPGMDRATRGPARDPVVEIDHVEKLVRVGGL